MDAVLDRLWEYLVTGFGYLGETLFSLLSNLHFLGPVVLISLLALCTVGITKVLNRLIVTKRYVELEKNFHHWRKVRDEAVKCEDVDKGRRMARNIDKAELNRAYYDYFFEGLLLGIARRIIPIFFVFAFINEYYRPVRMLEIFGREFVLQFPTSSGEPVLIGAVFWFFISLLICYLLWAIGGRLLRRSKIKSVSPLSNRTGEVTC